MSVKKSQAAINKQKPPLSGGYNIEQNAQTTRPLTSCQYWFELPSGPFLIVRESFPFYLRKISSLFPDIVSGFCLPPLLNGRQIPV